MKAAIHPDHIGSAVWFRSNTGYRIYAGEGERCWIADIDLQFRERPIPNFYRLAGQSCKVDEIVKDGERIQPEEGFEIEVIGTAGHSVDEMPYQIETALFIGDSVPVKGDISIFVDEQASRNTLKHIGAFQNAERFYPAWDHMHTKEEMQQKLKEAEMLMDTLKKAVEKLDRGTNPEELTDAVCSYLKMPILKSNPLFIRTIACLRDKTRSY